MKNNDIKALIKIVQHSVEVKETIEIFDLDFDSFKKNHVVKNAIAMCILQIGELSGKLTDEFKSTHTEIPWQYITATRNRLAHDYERADMQILWDAASISVPELKLYCENIVNKNKKINLTRCNL